MPLNFGLLGDAGAPISGYLQGQQDIVRNQLAQQQIETGRIAQDKTRMEMDAFKRRQAGLDQFMQKAKELGVNGDPEQLTQAYWEHAVSTGDPQEIKAAMIAVQTAKERKAYMGGQPSVAGAMTAPVSTTNNLGTALPPAGAPAPANAMTAEPAAVNTLATPPAANRLTQIESRLAELRRFPNVPEAKQERDDLIKERDKLMTPHSVAAGGSMYNPITGKFEQAPEKTPAPHAPPTMVAEYNFAKTPEGGGYVGSFEKFVRDRAIAARPPGAPRPESAPVAVVDPKTGKPILVTREQSFGMTPASAQESLPPKEIQQREAKYPQATSAVKTFEAKSDALAADMEKLAKHPGLSGISGLIYGRTPAVTKEARAAQALYDSIVARGGFAELQNMRASSPTGGALGNVSNQEGQYLRDAFAPISRTQDTGDLKTALTNAANATRAAKQRVRDAYDMTYEYKTGGAAPTPAAAGGGEWKVVK